MFKKLSFILLLVISVFGLALGGKYIYDKQAYQLSFSNFNISNEATHIYIPNVKLFYELNIDTDGFDFPSDVVVAKTKVLAFLKKNNITDELYMSYDKDDYIVSIKQHSFNSEKFIVFLENQLNIDVNKSNHTVRIGSSTFYYFTENDFFVFATSKIQLQTVQPFVKPNGNYHYLVQKSNSPTQQFFKQYNNALYVFNLEQGDTIKGKPVSPEVYYNTIPSNFDTLRFYGSSRFQDDINRLTSTKKSEFFSWVNNGVIHLKKDSLEILIGIQNEFQNLGDILDEQTLKLSIDSLLPSPIVKNNYKIHPFKSNTVWKSILPFNHYSFNYYSEFNNYNVLGNSEQAMNWFIIELQLGNVFSTHAPGFHHPENVHQLMISQTESAHFLVSKNWTNKTDCFVAQVSSVNTVLTNDLSLPLVSTFPIDMTNFKIKTFIIEDTLEVLLFNDEKIISYTSSGQINWTKELDSPLISFPVKVKNDSVDYIVLFMKQSVDVINKGNASLVGFPFKFNSLATKGNAIQNTNNFRLLVEIDKQIVNINENGVYTEGWSNPTVQNQLKSKLEIGISNNQPIISYVDINDSLFVIDKFGQSVLDKNVQLNLNHSTNFISGHKENNNLRVHGFSSPYIMSQLIRTGQKDSLLINQKLEPTGVRWTEHDNKVYLVIEEFNRVIIFNEFGLLEKEIQKPIPNLRLLSNAFFDDDIIVFSDFKNKKLYLLDSYGRNISEFPLSGESNFDTNYKYVVVYFNSEIYIYNLKTY